MIGAHPFEIGLKAHAGRRFVAESDSPVKRPRNVLCGRQRGQRHDGQGKNNMTERAAHAHRRLHEISGASGRLLLATQTMRQEAAALQGFDPAYVRFGVIHELGHRSFTEPCMSASLRTRPFGHHPAIGRDVATSGLGRRSKQHRHSISFVGEVATTSMDHQSPVALAALGLIMSPSCCPSLRG